MLRCYAEDCICQDCLNVDCKRNLCSGTYNNSDDLFCTGEFDPIYECQGFMGSEDDEN